MNRFAQLRSAVFVGAASALIVSLLAVLFTNDIGILLFLGVGFIIGTALVGLSIGMALRPGRHIKGTAFAAFAVFLTVSSVVALNQSHLRPRLLWFFWSHRYKSEVLAVSTPNGELRHIEWDGDGWGSAATGDWMGYVVFDPSDTLSSATKTDTPSVYGGIPCTVIKVRRLEKQWYSVVLDMNQFWDSAHPRC